MIQRPTGSKLNELSVRPSPRLLLLITLVATNLGACGGGGSVFDAQNAGSVIDVKVDPSAIVLGERATIKVRFDPATFIDSDGDESVTATDVVVLLPPGMDFVSTSSQLDGSILEGFNDRPANTVEICPDGSRALWYEFGGGELSDLGANSIKFDGQAFEARGAVSIRAAARDSLGAACDVTPQGSEEITLNR